MTKLYFDYQSTTPVDPLVLDQMMPFFSEKFGNPHSLEHDFGLDAHDVVEAARGEIAKSIGASGDEIIFTSGATEANNLALRGLLSGELKDNHIISCATEHSSILSVLRFLEGLGAKVTLLKVDAEGLVDPDSVRAAMTSKTRLLSIMTVNNETGVIQNMDELGGVCEELEVPLHSDGAQALGKIRMDVNRQKIDLMSLSSHKAYGPKGIGALYCTSKLKKKLSPILWGGGQEFGIRPGTIPTPLAVGFGKAANLAVQNMAEENQRILELRQHFFASLREQVDDVRINGSVESRIAGNLNLCIPEIDAESLLHMVPNIALSTGSACSFSAAEPSHVLMAMGLSYEDAGSSIRVGLGRFTTKEEVNAAVEQLSAAIVRLRP